MGPFLYLNERLAVHRAIRPKLPQMGDAFINLGTTPISVFFFGNLSYSPIFRG